MNKDEYRIAKKYIIKLGRIFIPRSRIPEVSRKIARAKDKMKVQVIKEDILAAFQMFSCFMINHDLARYLIFNKGTEIRICVLKKRLCL
ncbi:MAG: hypothetical protein BRC29_01460 [Nanohaloarchaea archaeon SW_7_43_1]|nr:MAG: hypothetical protein BRC29_01460 [Nanohaloarchaea archaeon SW_7_43_1]